MKVKEFLLIDEGDNYFQDIVVLKEAIELEKVKEIIRKLRDLGINYDNEMVYDLLESNFEVDYIMFTESMERVYY